MYLAIVVGALLVIYILLDVPIFLYEKKRDALFKTLAEQNNLEVIYDHRNYDYWAFVIAGDVAVLRTLRGRINGKDVMIQDYFRPSLPFLFGWFWYLYYFVFPTIFIGAKTRFVVNDKEEDISNRSFWALFPFANYDKIESVLRSS